MIKLGTDGEQSDWDATSGPSSILNKPVSDQSVPGAGFKTYNPASSPTYGWQTPFFEASNTNGSIFSGRVLDHPSAKIVQFTGFWANHLRFEGGWNRMDFTASSGIYLNGSVFPQGNVTITRSGDATSVSTQKNSRDVRFQASTWVSGAAQARESSIRCDAINNVADSHAIMLTVNASANNSPVDRFSVNSDSVLWLDGESASAPTTNPPRDGFYLYVDPTTGDLMAKGSAGTVTTIAQA